MSSAGVEHICHKGEMVTNLMVLLSKKNDVVFGVLYSAPRRNCSTGVEEKVPHCLYYCCIIIVCNIDCKLLISHCQHHVKNSSY